MYSKDFNGYPQMTLDNFDQVITKPSQDSKFDVVHRDGPIIIAANDLTIASQTKAGVIKVGKGLEIMDDGTLNVALHVSDLIQDEDEMVIFDCGDSDSFITE